ncbi:hypothetical protein DM860_002224 [Cuscuta australis]|uniref:Uncharacterized protein n=1 Tax=Cuscuta australis TaxID=267555 RepID=A0A328E0J8_9ASTE|nr:hypothetical protein DM860_002224 [Cuscuta australis]
MRGHGLCFGAMIGLEAEAEVWGTSLLLVCTVLRLVLLLCLAKSTARSTARKLLVFVVFLECFELLF